MADRPTAQATNPQELAEKVADFLTDAEPFATTTEADALDALADLKRRAEEADRLRPLLERIIETGQATLDVPRKVETDAEDDCDVQLAEALSAASDALSREAE